MLKVLLQVAFVWPCTVLRKNHHSCASIPPCGPSETSRQQGSSMVSTGRPNLTEGNAATKTTVCLPNKRTGLNTTRVCTTCHKGVRESRSPPAKLDPTDCRVSLQMFRHLACVQTFFPNCKRWSVAKGSQFCVQLFTKPLQLGFTVLPESVLEFNLLVGASRFLQKSRYSPTKFIDWNSQS